MTWMPGWLEPVYEGLAGLLADVCLFGTVLPTTSSLAGDLTAANQCLPGVCLWGLLGASILLVFTCLKEGTTSIWSGLRPVWLSGCMQCSTWHTIFERFLMVRRSTGHRLLGEGLRSKQMVGSLPAVGWTVGSN